MTDILFTHSYFLRLDPKQFKLRQPYPPLGTMYAAAVARENGFTVMIHDTMFEKKASNVINIIEKESPRYFVVYDDGFNYLTKMCLTNMRNAALEMIHFAGIMGCIVIVSSSDANDHPEKYLDAGASFVIKGEAEQTLMELIKCIEDGRDVETVAGICFKNEGRLIEAQKRSVLKDLDSIPFPAWDLVNIQQYRKLWMQSAGYFSLNIATTRGCPFKCNWCAKPIYGNRYNVRSPENVVKELKMLKSKFNFDHIWFCDDIFGLKPGWVQEFANLVAKEKLPLRFKIQSRADLLLQDNYVQSLADAGCETVWMGAESGSQKILDAMDKGIKVHQIEEATAMLKSKGIKPCFFIQFGYLDEDFSDIESTICMIKKLMPNEIGISVSYPLPGTKFYDKVKQQLSQKSNWTDSDELILMFTNKQSPGFYKALHRYVHKTFRKNIALQQAKKMIRNPLKLNFQGIKKILAGLYYIPASFIARNRLRQLQNFK